MTWEIPAMDASFTCPRCGAIPHHPMDTLEGYCGACHDWTGSDPMNPRYYRRDGTRMPMREWTQAFEQEDRTVAKTDIGDIHISTVWLGLDHGFGFDAAPPLIFETMIFGGPLNDEMWRYPTEEAALAGHDQAVAAVREADRAGKERRGDR